MRAIYIYKENFGRMGDLMSLFVADDREADFVIRAGTFVYLGEVLGKHSDISANMNEETTKKISIDPVVVDFVAEYGPIGIDLWGRYKDDERFG